jgi:tRNA (mo5U34)-methyltransferase
MPRHLSSEALFSGIDWYQRWEVFRGVFTPGRNPVAALTDAAELPHDLRGRRVLDVGAWHGCFSFECERRGAAEVVAYSLEDPEASGFNRLKHALDSRVRYVRGSVYDLQPDEVGTFDLVLFFGVLYHLRYPLLAIDRLRSISTGDVLIETHVVGNRLLLRGRLAPLARIIRLASWFHRTPVWRQYREFELQGGDRSNWFGPNACAVIEAFDSAGFRTKRLRAWGERATFRATARTEHASWLDGSYEGVVWSRD